MKLLTTIAARRRPGCRKDGGTYQVMRIAHLSIARQFTPGQAQQLTFEYEAANMLGGIQWHTLAYHTGQATEPFMRTIPGVFRLRFLRALFGWIVAFRLSKRYDVVMMRHTTFDPFALLFSHFIPNRISVHHAKEVEELRLIRKGWKGRAAALLERVTGRIAVRNALAILGVTQEIAEYERDLHAPGKPVGVYPNGIDPELVAPLDDARDAVEVQAVFMCGTFSAWHGLDKLIAAVEAHDWKTSEVPLTIHLIGRLTEQQTLDLVATEASRTVFRVHGLMSPPEYREIMAGCDIGMTSFALERKGLSEASTLKVREMLAMGLAVYSGHEDIALPPEQPFVRITRLPTVAELLAFGKVTKALSRAHIRQASLDTIDKARWMQEASDIARMVLQRRPVA